MALNNTTNYLQTLISAADDAHSNLYIARFSGGFLTDVSDNLSIRAEGFTPPRTSQRTYDIAFMNQTIQRPSAKVDVTRHFDLTFRLDANYVVFKALLDQQGITFNPAQGFTATNIKALKDLSNRLFDTTLEVAGGMIDTEPVFSRLFTFKNCWITKITPISYSTANSDAATVTTTFNFLELQDIHSGFENQITQ